MRFSLNKKNAFILGLDRNTVAQSRIKNGTLKPLFVEHLLDVNVFFINFALLVNSHPGLRIELWLDEYDAQDEYKSQQNSKTIIRKSRPDSYGRYWHKDRLYSFFLELDRSTESSIRFEDKLNSYIEYHESGSYERKFGVKFFRVLVVTTSNKHLSNLKQSADNTGKDYFWFTTTTWNVIANRERY